MAMHSEKAANVSYTLLERLTDLLICSRCFKRNVRRPVRQLLSSRHRPLPVCDECSGRLKPGHTAKVLKLG